MDVSFFPHTLLLFIAVFTTSFCPTAASEPPPPPTVAKIENNQIGNIIDAIISTGDYAIWGNLTSFSDPSIFPISATLFIPRNDAVSHLPSPNAAADGTVLLDPFLVPYHIVPQRFTFSELQQFPIHTRLPTLLPSEYIVITNNSLSNFTIDDSQIMLGDAFLNDAFSVHAIEKLLDYTVYGGSNSFVSPKLVTADPPEKTQPIYPGEITADLRSSDALRVSEILLLLSKYFALFGLLGFFVMFAYALWRIFNGHTE